jgi:hypothetical protein
VPAGCSTARRMSSLPLRRHNIDVLAPQNFYEVMYTGFREVIDGMRSPAERAGALQRAWEEAKEAGKIPAQE